MVGIKKSYNSVDETHADYTSSIDTAGKIAANLVIKEKSKKLTRKQIVIVLNLAYGNFCLGSIYSIMAPFFPREAELKGATPTEYGFIFGIYELGVFILSPFIGKMIPHLSPNFLLVIGLFVAGFCNTLFGLLQWSPHGLTFVALALATRFFASVGGAAFFTACFTLIASDFPDRVSTLFATTEMCFGVGMIIGPALGGFLFEIGNFSLPFFASGSLTLLGAFTTYLSLPETKPQEVGSKVVNKVGVFQLLSNFGISLNICVCVVSFILIGFNDATLEPHIRTVVALSPTALGGIFLLSGLVYALTSQIWGILSEKAPNAHPYCVIGYVFSLVGFLYCGPMYGISIKPTLWLIIVSQMLFSIGVGGQLVGSFTEGLRETLRSGYPDDISTLAAVSSLFTCGFSLGAAIGPVLGGFLLENYGYAKACVSIELIQIILVTTIIIFNLYRKSSFKLNKGLKQTLHEKASYGSIGSVSNKVIS